MPIALPPELSWTALLIVMLTVMLAYSVFGATGFGSSIISVPILAHLLPLTFVVPLVTAVDCAAAATATTRQWRLVDWREFRRVMAPALAGIAIGSTLLVNLPRNAALLALGVFVTAFSIYTLAGAHQWQSISPRWSIPAGLVGGVFSALFGTGGPLYMMYLSSRIPDKSVLRATSSMVVGTSVAIRAVAFGFTTLWQQQGMLTLILLLLPLMLVGYLLGSRVHAQLGGSAIRRGIAWLLLANAVLLIVRSLAGSR